MREKIKYINNDRIVDYSDLILKGKTVIKIDWKNSVGKSIICYYYNVKYSFLIKKYEAKTQNLTMELEGKEIKAKTKTIMQCEIGRLIGKITNNFKYNIGDNIIDEKRNFTITNTYYKNNSKNYQEKYYSYKCNKCSYEGEIKEGNLNKGDGCPCCSNKIVVKGINDIATTNPELLSYFANKEDAYTHTIGSGDKILVICPNCGYKKEMKIYNISPYGISCPYCSDGFSYPNKILAEFCRQLKEIYLIKDYKLEWSPEHLEGRRNDALIILSDNKSIVIEMDGGLGHKGGKIHSYSKKTLEQCIEEDEWKENKNLLYGIETIRINCSVSELDFIKNNIINSKIKEYIELDSIDWKKCEEMATNNLCKQICDYRNKYKELSNTDIATEFNISQDTVLKYIKIGNELGWCNYDVANPIKNFHNYDFGKKRIKIVEIDKEYSSLKECVANLEKDIGFSIHVGSIIRGMKANRKVKGYTFIYI